MTGVQTCALPIYSLRAHGAVTQAGKAGGKRYACEPDEAEPLGMMLCASKSEEHIALLELQKSGVHVASYWTEALPKKELERKLHEAVRLARARLEAGKD